MKLKVCHLIDDANYGGINRGLDHVARDAGLSAMSICEVIHVKRGQLTPPHIQADVIVSHLSICWKNMPLLTALRCFNPRTPIIHVEHSYSERFVAAYVPNKDRFDTLMRAAFSLFDTIVAVSEDQANWMVRRRYVAADEVWTIPSCASLSSFLDVAPRVAGPTLIVGAVGRMHLQKGFDILIRGFRKTVRTDMELHLYGDGPQLDELKALAGDDPRIIFKGYTPDTASAMAACDVVAMPSRWEPYGIVAVEAMAARRAIACSNADGLAGHIRVGAIGISDNTSSGWAQWLATVSHGDLLEGEQARFDYGSRAEQRFSDAWVRLLSLSTGRHQAMPLQRAA